MPPETNYQPETENNAAEKEQHSEERPKDHSWGSWDQVG
jgi:hypothetical protein